MEGHSTQHDGSGLTRELRIGLVTLVAWLFAIGGSLFFLSEETDTYFSWTIEPPLTAAFLGAAYLSGCLLAILGVRERYWAYTRPLIGAVPTVTILLLIPTLIHLDRFHMDDATGWVWLIVYATMPPIMVLLIVRQLRAAGPDPPRTAPFPGWFKRLVEAQALGALALGLALFVAPSDADGLWPWELTPLTGRAVGAWALGGAVFLGLIARESDWLRVRSAMMSFCAFGILQLIAVARYSDTFDWDGPGSWIYLGVLMSAVAQGAFAWRMAIRSAGSAPVPSPA